MADIALTQLEADTLLGLEKRRIDNTAFSYPEAGQRVSIPLESVDKREKFLLDINRGRINLNKRTHQNRARQVICLARLDLDGSPHRNPDDTEVPCPHLHLYREGFGDKWAFAVPADVFTDLNDPWQVLQDFMRYCNITEGPRIDRGLFI